MVQACKSFISIVFTNRALYTGWNSIAYPIFNCAESMSFQKFRLDFCDKKCFLGFFLLLKKIIWNAPLHPTPRPPPPGPGYLCTESTYPTGYRVWLVSVSESGSQVEDAVVKVPNSLRILRKNRPYLINQKLQKSENWSCIRFGIMRIFWGKKIDILVFIFFCEDSKYFETYLRN